MSLNDACGRQLSTLRRFVAALGGELQILARFPQGDMVVNQFEDIPKRKESVRTE